MISAKRFSFWRLEMAFFAKCTAKYSSIYVAAHEISNDFAPLLFLLPLVFDHRRTFHLLFCCVRKHVYFPFSLWFWYVGAYEGCFYVSNLVEISISSMCYDLIAHCLIFVHTSTLQSIQKKWEFQSDNARILLLTGMHSFYSYIR